MIPLRERAFEKRIAQTTKEKAPFGKRMVKKDTCEKCSANMQPLRNGLPAISFGKGGWEWKLSMGSFGKGGSKDIGYKHPLCSYLCLLLKAAAKPCTAMEKLLAVERSCFWVDFSSVS